MLDEGAISGAVAAFKRSKDYKRIEVKLDFCALVLVGPAEPQWFGRGANAPRRGCAVGVTQAVDKYVSDFNKRNPYHPMVVLDVVWLRSPEHAARVKDRLEILCYGDREENRMHARFFDLLDYAKDWPLLLGEAKRQIEARGETIEFFTTAEKDRAIFEASRSPYTVPRWKGR